MVAPLRVENFVHFVVAFGDCPVVFEAFMKSDTDQKGPSICFIIKPEHEEQFKGLNTETTYLREEFTFEGFRRTP